MVQVDFIFAINQEINVVFYSMIDLKMYDELDFAQKPFVVTKIELLDTWTKYTATRTVASTTVVTKVLLQKLKSIIDNKELKFING